MYGIYINLGFRFEFTTQKLPYETILGNFYDFIDFVIRSGQKICCKKRWDLHKIWVADFNSEHKNYPFLNIRSCNSKFKKIWDLHKFGLQIWIHAKNAKITLWKNFGQFFRFHRFWSSGPGMRKKVISQY